MERDIYINASSISHFTQFNHFTKPNDEVSLLSKYNSWFTKYHTVQQPETLSQMVNKLSVSEVSHLGKALEFIAEPVISQPEPTEPITSEPNSEPAALAQELYARMEKVIESKKEGEQIPIPNLTANLRDLSIAVEQAVTLNRGILHESQDIQASGLNIVSHNIFYKRELLRFSHKDTLYRVLVGGRVDGLLGDDTIVETKHRRNRLFNCIYNYEKVQIEIYLFLLDKKKCLHIENFNGESNQIYYDRDPDFLAEIKLQVQHRLIELLNEWVYKVKAGKNEPEETAAREGREACQSE